MVHTTRTASTARSLPAIPMQRFIVPPRSSAVPSETAENAPTPRDRHLQAIAKHGRMGLAESVEVQLACLGGSRYWPLETGHRSRAALANQRASSGRSGNCCRRPEPYAGAGTPELR